MSSHFVGIRLWLGILVFVGWAEAETTPSVVWRFVRYSPDCVTLRLTNLTSRELSATAANVDWCYSSVPDAAGHPRVPSLEVPCRGGCGCIRNLVRIAARQSIEACVAPSDLRPGSAVGLAIYGRPFQMIYFGHSDLPPAVRREIGKRDAKPCLDIFFRLQALQAAKWRWWPIDGSEAVALRAEVNLEVPIWRLKPLGTCSSGRGSKRLWP